MKYKAVYDVLNERRQATPGFCYHDRSGWRAYPQTYMTMQYPLWIIAEDAATGRRLWITQEGTRFSISIRRMDEQRRNYGPTYRITCENRTKLAQVLSARHNHQSFLWSAIPVFEEARHKAPAF